MVPAFLLMLREGLEAALIVGILAAYLVRIGRSDALPRVWAGVLAALGLSVVIGLAIFVGGIRINLRRFFTVTGTVLIFVAAGLVAFSIHEFGEAGVIT